MLKKMKRNTSITVVIMLWAINSFSLNVKPQEAYLKISGRTASQIVTDKDDRELRIGAAKLDLYNVYWLIERENYLNTDLKEWFTGYGSIVDLLKHKKVKMQFETFDRSRYDSNSQSYRTFLTGNLSELYHKLPGINLQYGISMLGKNYRDFQPAAFLGGNYKKFNCKLEVDIDGKLVSTTVFKPEIVMSKTTGIKFNLEHRHVDRDFYTINAMMYYKEVK